MTTSEFINREDTIGLFKNLSRDTVPVLNLYGLLGIGKTALINEFVQILANDNDKNIYVTLDLEDLHYVDQTIILERLVLELRKKFDIPFYSYFATYFIYYKRIGELPKINQTEFGKEVLNTLDLSTEIVSQVFSNIGDLLVPSTLTKIGKLILDSYEWLKDWWFNKTNDFLTELQNKKPGMIQQYLPISFVDDIIQYLHQENKKLYLFLDNYHLLWESERGSFPGCILDPWIRFLVKKLREESHWIIMGERKLFWGSCEDHWNEDLWTKKIEGFSEKDSHLLLENKNLNNSTIRNDLIQISRGGVEAREGEKITPFFLNLAYDTFYDEDRDIITFEKSSFEYTLKIIMQSFLERRSEYREIWKVLGVIRQWDTELLEGLIRRFNIDFPLTVYNEFLTIYESYIINLDNNFYCLHSLLRNHIIDFLIKEQNEIYVEINKFAFNYYSNKLSSSPISSSDQINWLFESVYHKLKLTEEEPVVEWYLNYAQKVSIPLSDLYPISKYILQIIEESDEIWYLRFIYFLAKQQFSLSLYGGAIRNFKYYLKVCPEEESVDNVKRAKIHHYLAYSIKNNAVTQEELEESEEFVKQAILLIDDNFIEDEEIVYRSNYEMLPEFLNTYASILNDQEKHQEAIQILKKAYTISQHTTTRISSGLNILNNYGFTLIQQNKINEAEKVLEDLIDQYKALEMEDELGYAFVLNNLGMCKRNRGDYENAIIFLKESLQKRKVIFGENHQAYALALDNLTSINRDVGNFDEADTNYKEAMRIFKESLTENHPHFATTMYNYAEFLEIQGNYDEAEKLYLECISIRERSYGENIKYLLNPLSNLQRIYLEQGRLDEREEISDRTRKLLQLSSNSEGGSTAKYPTAIEEIRNFFDLDLSETSLKDIISKTELAVKINLSRGSYEVSEQLYITAIEIIGQKLPEFPFKIVDLLLGLLQIYVLTGEIHKEEKYFKKILKVLPRSHPKYILSLELHARFLEAIGRYQEAKIRYKEVLGLLEEKNQIDSEKYLRLKGVLARVLQRNNQFDSARRIYKELTPRMISKFGNDHRQLAYFYQQKGVLFLRIWHVKGDNENLNHAMKYLKRARDIAIPFNDVHCLALVFQAIGDVHKASEAYKDAIATYEQAISYKETIYGKESINVVDILLSTSYCHYQLGEFGKVEKIHKKIGPIENQFFVVDTISVNASLVDYVHLTEELAKYYYDQRDYNRTLLYLGKAIELSEKGILEKNEVWKEKFEQSKDWCELMMTNIDPRDI